MPAPYYLMGYARQLFVGTAGTTASTQVTNVLDLNYDKNPTYGPTTERGDGSGPVIESEKITARKPTITWSMNNKPNDTQLATLRAAADSATGTIAIVLKENDSSGSAQTIVDGDFNVTYNEPNPLTGSSTFDFTATPSADHGRTLDF